jgi:hypothetical protein
MGLFTYTALTRLEAPFVDGGIWLQADDDAFRHINLAKSGCGTLRRGDFVQGAPTLVVGQHTGSISFGNREGKQWTPHEAVGPSQLC